jgi:hypothetical protein
LELFSSIELFLIDIIGKYYFSTSPEYFGCRKKAFYYIEIFQLKQFKVRTVLMKFLQEDSKLRPPNNPGSQFPEFP